MAGPVELVEQAARAVSTEMAVPTEAPMSRMMAAMGHAAEVEAPEALEVREVAVPADLPWGC